MSLIQMGDYSKDGNAVGVIPKPYVNFLSGNSYNYASKTGGSKKNHRKYKTKKIRKNKRARKTRYIR
jgi:hypothetical protein